MDPRCVKKFEEKGKEMIVIVKEKLLSNEITTWQCPDLPEYELTMK